MTEGGGDGRGMRGWCGEAVIILLLVLGGLFLKKIRTGG